MSLQASPEFEGIKTIEFTVRCLIA